MQWGKAMQCKPLVYGACSPCIQARFEMQTEAMLLAALSPSLPESCIQNGLVMADEENSLSLMQCGMAGMAMVHGSRLL